MTSQTFEDRVPKSLTEADNLPSLPAVALEVLRLTQKEDSTIDELAACLSRDPALAAKILKLSNSSLFSPGTEVTSIQRATMMLGLKTVKVMALSFSLADSIPKSGSEPGFHFDTYWERSVTRSVAARATVEMVGSKLGDEAYLCGLLAHFGRLVMARTLRSEYAALAARQKGWPTVEQEEVEFGFSNLDVCGTLLKTWGLPEMLYSAICCWHPLYDLPTDACPQTKELVNILRASDLAEQVLCGEDKGAALTELREFMETCWNMDEHDVEGLIMSLEGGIAETADLLSIQLPSDLSMEDVLSEAKQQIVFVSLGQEMELKQAREDRERLSAERERLITKATTDQLTGIPNRAHFDEFLEAQVSKRLGEPAPRALGLAMIDIDHFKIFNDTYGHQAGDEVLRRVGQVLSQTTRKGDLAARYGGEEFAVISPETNPFNMRAMCERIRKAIADIPIELNGETVQVTASFGGACIARFNDLRDQELFIKLADSLLYRAKELGRNRVEVYKRITFPRR